MNSKKWQFFVGPVLELVTCILFGIVLPLWARSPKTHLYYTSDAEQFFFRLLGVVSALAILNLFRMPRRFIRAGNLARLEEEAVVTKGVICDVSTERRGEDRVIHTVVVKADGKYFPVRTEGDYGPDAVGKLVPLRYSRRDSDIYEVDMRQLEWAPEDIPSQPHAQSPAYAETLTDGKKEEETKR